MYTFTKAYTYGDSGQLLAFTQNGKKYFYHYNAQGDVIAISDSTGKTVAKYQYDAWGNPTKTEASDEVKDNRYRYAGYQYDEETGLYYLMARYYEPRNGVFLPLDPDPGSDGDSLDQNGYAYGNNNPVMNVDPDGHWVWLVVNAGFAAYDGYKAYKSGKGWKGAAWAAASNFGPGKIFKGAKRVYRFANKAKRGWFNKESWHHIKDRQGPKRDKKYGKKGKFKSTRALKRTTRSTLRSGKARKGQYGRTVYEKTFKRYVGVNGNKRKTKRVRVIREKNGRVVTSFPY
ncbi:hypothetical protein BLX91_04335 [Bacillus subtilis]|nr:hypothetical protein BLX91_04335 [Bacillus subtilis]